MSNNIDYRIVEMQFNNANFEKNIKESMKSLDKLKEGLNLEKSAESLEALQKAGNKFNLDNLSKAAETITNKFSFLGVVGDQVIRKLTDVTLNALNKMRVFIDGFVTEPIRSGFSEYETQINSVQTILSNTRDAMEKLGLSEQERLDIVNEKLDQLNSYADKTIYNFTEMTRNIGTFTAAGVELNTAVDSIQGIANLAAVSGSNSEQASRAMYQLSQAISTGALKLQDWNSVVNAGMGGELFQKALMRTGKAMGVQVDSIVEKAGSFRESLSEGWLTSDILTATLQQMSWDFEQMAKEMGYTAANMEHGVITAMDMKKGELIAQGYSVEDAEDIVKLAKDATDAATKVKTFTQLLDTLKEAAQSGWTQTWEYIIGDFEEAKKTLTDISDFFGDIIEASSDARNAIFKDWKDAGGRDLLFNNDPEKGPLGALWNLAYGIQNIFSLIGEEIGKLFKPFTGGDLLSITTKIQSITASFLTFTQNSEKMEVFRRIIAGIGSALNIVKIAVMQVASWFSSLLGMASPSAGAFLEYVASIGDFFSKINDYIQSSGTFKEVFSGFAKVLSSLGKAIRSVFGTAWTIISKVFNKIKDSGIISSFINNTIGFVKKIPRYVVEAKDWLIDMINYFEIPQKLQNGWSAIKTTFGNIHSGFIEIVNRLKTAINNFFNADVSKDDNLWSKLQTRFMAFGSVFSDWFVSIKTNVMEIWVKIKEFFINFFTNTIPEFFNSKISNISGIVNKIKEFDWANLVRTVLGSILVIDAINMLRDFSKIGRIADSFKNLTKTVKEIAKNGMSITKDGIQIGEESESMSEKLKNIAIALAAMTASLYLLSKMDLLSLLKGVGVITLIFLELTVVSYVLSKVEIDGESVMKLSTGLLILTGTVMLVSLIPFTTVLKGVLQLGTILLMLALFTKLVNTSFSGKNMGFIGLSVSILLLTLAMKRLASLSLGGVLKNVIGLGLILSSFSSAIRKMTKEGDRSIKGLIGFTVGLNLIVFAMKQMATLETSKLIATTIAMTILMKSIGSMAQTMTGINLKSAIAVLIAVGAPMLLFIETFKMVEKSDMNALMKFTGSFVAAYLALAIGLKVISKIGTKDTLKAAANISIMSFVLLGITTVIGLISNINGASGVIKSGAESFLMMSVAAFSLGWAIRAIGKLSVVDGLKAIGNLSLMIGVMTGFMLTFGLLVKNVKGFESTLKEGQKLFSLIGGAINKFFVSLFLGDNFSFDLEEFGNSLSRFSANAAPFFDFLKTLDGKTLDGALTLGGVLLSAGFASLGNAFFSAIGNIDVVEKFTKDLTRLAGGLVAYGIAVLPLKLISQSTLDKSVSLAKSLTEIANAIPLTGSFFSLLSGVGSLKDFSGQLGELGTGLSDFVMNLSGLSGDNYDHERMENLVKLAGQLAEVEGKMPKETVFSNIIGGTQSFAGFGDDAELFGDGLNKFIEEIKKVTYDPGKDGTKVTAIVDIAERLASLEKDLMPIQVNGVEGAVKSVRDLGAFGDSVGKFSTGLNGFIAEATALTYDPVKDGPKVDSVIGIASTLANLEKNLEGQGGLEDAIQGVKSLSKFSEQFDPFYTGLNNFIANVRLIDYDKDKDKSHLDAVVDVAITLSEFEKKLEAQGGLADSLFGEKSLSTFSTNITDLGRAIKTYTDDVSGIKTDEFGNIPAVFTKIQEFIDGLDPSGSIWDKLANTFGEGSRFETLKRYSESMATLGSNFKTFAQGSKTIKMEDVDKAGEVFKHIQMFVESLDSEDGSSSFWNWFEQGNRHSDFQALATASGYMGDFGDAFGRMTKGMSEVETASSDFDTAKTLYEKFQTFNNEINELYSDTDYSNLALSRNELELFGLSINTFNTRLGEISSENVTAAASLFTGLSNIINTFRLGGLTDLSPVEQVLFNLSNITLPDFNLEGAGSADTFLSSLTSSLTTAQAITMVSNASTSLSSTARIAVANTASLWADTGRHLARGLAIGINSSSGIVASSARNVATLGINGIKNTWAVESPSKVGIELGQFFDLGLSKGLTNYSNVVSNSMVKVAENVVDSASTMLIGSSNSIFDYIDPNPTIRPVMDLTNIQNGVGVLDSMLSYNKPRVFGSIQNMNSSTMASSVSLDSGRVNTNFTDRNIVNKLDSLQERINTLSSAVTSMNVVLDTGVLVGATSSRMDNELGRISMRKNRGN